MCGAKHGQIYGWDDAKPPAHPGCIVEGTEIESPDGIIAGTRSKYDGLVVKLLFASGRSLSVTPNHPVLTPNGFVSANLLREGDDVLCRPNFERVLEIDPDDNQEVTTVEKVFGALLESPGVVSRAMPVSPEDFHGDAAFIYGDVDIIWSNSLLRATGKSITFEPISEDLFCPGRTENHFLSGGCILASFLNSADPSFVCNMSRLCEFCNFFRGGLGHSEVHRLAAPSRNHPARLESSSNGVSGAPELFRECLHGCSLIIASEDLTGVNVSNKRHSFTFPEFDSSSFKPFLDHRRTAPNKSSHFSRSIPGLVEIDKVVDIEVIRHSGYVYDFQSISSLLLCNGILVSNCRCRPIGWFRPRTKEEIAESERIKAKALEKPWDTPGTPADSADDVADQLIDDILPKKMAYPGSKIERPKLEHKSISIEELDIFQKMRSGAVIGTPDDKEDMLLKMMAEQLGYAEKGVIVNEKEFSDIVVNGGHTKLLRGVADSKYTEQFKYGDYFAGKGLQANGIYTAYGESMERTVNSYRGKGEGTIITMALDKDAKIIDGDKLRELFYKENLDLLKSTEPKDIINLKFQILQDPGRFAMLKGYDAIRLPENEYMVVLNRKALYILDTNIGGN